MSAISPVHRIGFAATAWPSSPWDHAASALQQCLNALRFGSAAELQDFDTPTLQAAVQAARSLPSARRMLQDEIDRRGLQDPVERPGRGGALDFLPRRATHGALDRRIFQLAPA